MIRNIMLLVLTASLFTGCLWYDDDYDHRHQNGPPHKHDSDHRPDSNHHDHMNNNDYDHHHRPSPR